MVAPLPRAPLGRQLRGVAVLVAALTGLIAVRWAVTGGPTRSLAPPGSTAVEARHANGPAPADLALLRGNLLYLGGRQALVLDPASGAVSALDRPGAGRLRVLRQGGFIVLLARDGQAAVQPANGASRPRPLGQASDVLPSSHPDRVWLVTQKALAPDQTYLLREVDLATRRVLRSWTLPYDAEPVAVMPQGVVVSDLHDDLMLRDPSGRRPPRPLGAGLTFIDAHGGMLAYLDDRLHLRDLGSGRDRVVALPKGARSWSAVGPRLPGTGCCLQLGGFSPDAGTLAVFTEPGTPGAPGLVVVDVAAGRARLLPGSEGATPIACQPCLGWSRSGWLFFFNGGPGGADPAAWRPGERATVPIALDVSSVTSVLPTSIAAA